MMQNARNQKRASKKFLPLSKQHIIEKQARREKKIQRIKEKKQKRLETHTTKDDSEPSFYDKVFQQTDDAETLMPWGKESVLDKDDSEVTKQESVKRNREDSANDTEDAQDGTEDEPVKKRKLEYKDGKATNPKKTIPFYNEQKEYWQKLKQKEEREKEFLERQQMRATKQKDRNKKRKMFMKKTKTGQPKLHARINLMVKQLESERQSGKK